MARHQSLELLTGVLAAANRSLLQFIRDWSLLQFMRLWVRGTRVSASLIGRLKSSTFKLSATSRCLETRPSRPNSQDSRKRSGPISPCNGLRNIPSGWRESALLPLSKAERCTTPAAGHRLADEKLAGRDDDVRGIADALVRRMERSRTQWSASITTS
jgi:hypothetical protein